MKWIWILVAVGLLIGYLILYKKFATLPDNAIVMVNGGLGAGKSQFTIGSGYREYRQRIRTWKLRKILFPWKTFEKPVICSNVPLNCEYVPLTKDILERKKRLPYGSVVSIDEFSLVADSMSFKEINNTTLMLFIKLFRQSTKGGIMFVNTQALSDCHYAMKRCVNSYIWIFKRKKILFWILFKIRVFTINDETTMNIVENVDETRWYFLTTKVFKLYDTYAYSGLTDSLPVVDHTINGKTLADLKIHNYNEIASYIDYEREVVNNEKKKRK